MKILTQDRKKLIDTTGADIFLECDDEWCYVVLSKGKNTCRLGKYVGPLRAKEELSSIFRFFREKKDTYCMNENTF